MANARRPATRAGAKTPAAQADASPKKENSPGAAVTLGELAGVVDRLFPESLAEAWDNVGLQVGDPARAVRKVMVCLEVTDSTLAEARAAEADAILAHHPLIFKPFKTLRADTPAQRLAMELTRAGIGLIAAHTNMDSAAWGTNQILAERLGLEVRGPLEPRLAPESPVSDYKLIVFTPEGNEGRIIEAIHGGGGGRIGLYSHCTFRTAGVGTFIGGEGASPVIGQAGQFEEAREYRLETIVPAAAREAVIEAVRAAHPYEEPAYDLIPIATPVGPGHVGLGCVCDLPSPESVDRMVARIKKKMGLKRVRVSGPSGGRTIARAAICTGSGGSLLGRAARVGADAFITGEINYHAAVEAHQRGLTVIELGHFESEVIMAGPVAERLGSGPELRGRDIKFFAATSDFQPFDR